MTNNRPIDSSGFTLLELLVVLAIVGIMAGTAVFLTAPSATEKGKRLGAKTFELMQKARVSSMLKRRVYGIEVLEDNSAVRLVALIEDRTSSDFNVSNDFDDSEYFDDTLQDSVDSLVSSFDDELEDETPQITYTMHKMKAEALGLLIGDATSHWELEDDKDVVELPVSVNLGFIGDESESLRTESNDNSENLDDGDGEDDGEAEYEITPIVMFFPDGRLSNRGSFRFIDDKGEIVYSFTWTELGKFERVH